MHGKSALSEECQLPVILLVGLTHKHGFAPGMPIPVPCIKSVCEPHFIMHFLL